MPVLGPGEPPTWTREDGKRSWLAKVVYPARDTPLALVVLLTVAGGLATAVVFVDALADRSYVRMAFAVLVLGVNALVYASRLRVILRHRR